MLDICVLGCGGMQPLADRFLTACLCRLNGQSLLIDCGEGTQISLRRNKLSLKGISVICLTHFHADHVAGLPGLLASMANNYRTEPVTVIGPAGVQSVINAVLKLSGNLPFKVNCIELEDKMVNLSVEGFNITAFRANHTVATYGYSIHVPRPGKFSPEMAKRYGVPEEIWTTLQQEGSCRLHGKFYTVNMISGEEREGIKFTYCTDTRPVSTIVNAAKDSDLFVCEGMYAKNSDLEKAETNKHLLFSEAANLAKEAGVSELWLTHLSPGLVNPESHLDSVKKIFDNTTICTCGMSKTLSFNK